MSLKEFSVRCSAITHTTARAFGIVQAVGPKVPSALHAKAHAQQSGKHSGFSLHPWLENKPA